MDKGSISLCMIVKDEEHFIGDCLDSVQQAVDEIIVVDTGSTDETPAICKAKGARVLPFTWNNHFSEARNYGLEQAKGEWIFWMDADEKLEITESAGLRSVAHAKPDQHLFSVKLINFYGDPPADLDRSFLIAHHRVFRNRKGFRFHNSIHEQLNVHEILPDLQEVPMLPVHLYHYGYMDAVTAQRDKFSRNLHMLQEALRAGDPNPWIPYHMASEYYRIQEYKKSFEYVNQSIVSFIQANKNPPSLLYKLKYAVLLLLGSIEGAYPGIEHAIAMYPDYVDLHFYKGVIFFAKKRYEEAISVFRHCLELGETNLQHLVLRGLGSFQAWYYIGQCEMQRNRLPQAIHAYAQSLHSSPTHEPAWEGILEIMRKDPDTFPAQQVSRLQADNAQDQRLILDLLTTQVKELSGASVPG